ncbi:Os02g0618000 [Oryza sativa Japonica Group]|uniref:Os02g0618000 protein n=2 Tax=Oryza TaxID=4527 RepID=Q6K954_ORYSJ|nr:unknown protein [Oryza sativa Japonica Group]BAD21595.1 unknown protein [Oryza sativa Japonica Group]BAF09360.1 Os02g0618000 [Oryza sativa Japonica Group]|eukprot:NP_001047446.1 Os02g0618000 [Oryza sativa Japonica Group]
MRLAAGHSAAVTYIRTPLETIVAIKSIFCCCSLCRSSLQFDSICWSLATVMSPTDL